MKRYLVLLTLALFVLPRAARGQQSAAPIERLFLGDEICLDNATSCTYTSSAAHRYLHVILDDVPDNADWQVQSAAYCNQAPVTLAQGVPTDSQGFLEQVIDLTSAPLSLDGGQRCIILRGRNHWAVHYYAAYLDDSPSPDADQLFPDYRTAGGRPDLTDLDVTMIQRLPEYAYDAAQNAPAPGQSIQFVATVRNSGLRPALPTEYQWLLNGTTVASGTLARTLAPGEETMETLSLTWTPAPGNLTFRLAPLPDETSATNNALTIRTDALALGIWVEQSAWQYFNQNQWLYCRPFACAGSNSFEDWLQRQVSAWNGVLGGAVYPPLAPTGVADRVRLAAVHIVPDGALPLHGGRPTNTPDLSDHTVDLEWGIPAKGVAHTYPHNWEGPFDVDWGMLHELGHARSLADLYRFDVPADSTTTIAVTGPDGRPLYDQSSTAPPSPYLPTFTGSSQQTMVYQDEEADLMACTCAHFYSAYDALVLNRIQGQRATCGNTNPPCNLGDWFLDRPAGNRLLLRAHDGKLLPDGTVVQTYLDQGTSYTGHLFDNAHVRSFTVHDGGVDLGADPFDAGNSVSRAGHNLLLLHVAVNGTGLYCFVEPTLLNMAYWQGYRDAGHIPTYVLTLGRQSENDCRITLPAPLVNEPFGVSTTASTVAIRSIAAGRVRLTAILRDHGVPAQPLRERTVRVLDALGRVLASGVTGRKGRVQLTLRGRAAVARVLDVTDGTALRLPDSAARRTAAVPPRR